MANQLDVDDLRRRFGSNTLARAVAEAQGANGERIPAIPAVTLRGVRAAQIDAPTPDEMAEVRMYGPLSNPVFFSNVFAIEPVFKQFVISTCNAGIFRGRPSHINCVKIIQLICMARLRLRNALTGQAVTRQSFYQAMAMAEALGPFIPDAWKMNQNDAQAEIIRAAEWLITDDGMGSVNLAREEWFDHEVLGVDANILVAGRVPNIEVALILIEAMAVRLPSNNVWLNGVSFVSAVLLSIYRRGNATDELRTRVEQGVRDATSVASVNLGPATLKRFYSLYCSHIDATNAGRLFAHFQALIPDNVIALRNLVVQAAGSGLTTYMVILRAMCDFPDFGWAELMTMVGPEFRRLDTAIAAVAGNVYFGFNHQMAAASAKNFPNIAYASFQLCIRAGGDNPLRRYGGMPTVITSKLAIDQMLTDYLAARAGAVVGAQVPALVQDEWDNIADRALQAHQAMVAPAVNINHNAAGNQEQAP